MQYLAIVNDKNVGEYKVFGDGKKAQKHCLNILKAMEKAGDIKISIKKISDISGVPQATVSFLLRDYEIRKSKSTLHKVALEEGYNLKVYSEWNKENRWKHKKHIMSVENKR